MLKPPELDCGGGGDGESPLVRRGERAGLRGKGGGVEAGVKIGDEPRGRTGGNGVAFVTVVCGGGCGVVGVGGAAGGAVGGGKTSLGPQSAQSVPMRQ
eukprot:1788292-Pleurochrysis_carterae.AAC.1